MSLFQNAVRDGRVRDYVPVTRILAAGNISGAEIFIGNLLIQPVLTPCKPYATLERNGMILVDFGTELHGGIRLVNFGAGGRIRLRFGESVSEAMGAPEQSHAVHDTELDVPRAGMLEYGNTAFRFVRIDNLGALLTILNLVAVALYRDLEYVGKFDSSDERLNQVWTTAAHTLQMNMQVHL